MIEIGLTWRRTRVRATFLSCIDLNFMTAGLPILLAGESALT
jgi:hypothetical protein